MDDSQAQQLLGNFLGYHCGAVVGQNHTRQAPFLDPLGETMDEVLRSFGRIPLDVTAQPRMAIKDAQRNRALPPAIPSEHLLQSVMEIEMPQCPDVCGFIAADLSRLAPLFRKQFTGALARPKPRLFH